VRGDLPEHPQAANVKHKENLLGQSPNVICADGRLRP
jgi:hypothetical protein